MEVEAVVEAEAVAVVEAEAVAVVEAVEVMEARIRQGHRVNCHSHCTTFL